MATITTTVTEPTGLSKEPIAITAAVPELLKPTTNWADSPLALLKSPLDLPATTAAFPKDTHGALIMAHEMVHIHNMLLRGLNSIYQQAAHVPSPDVPDFLQYASMWCDLLQHHHDTEEDVFFPKLEEALGTPGAMDGNVAEHRLFDAGLKALKSYIAAAKAEPTTYDSHKLLVLISAFGPVLHAHLAAEIPSLASLTHADSDAVLAAFNAGGDHAKKTSVLQEALPLMLGCHDVGYEGGQLSNDFVPPAPLRWVVGYVLSRKFKGAWRFLPCDTKSRRQELAFGPRKEEE